MNQHKLLLAVLAAATLGLGAVPAGAQTQGVTDTAIKIGVMGPYTGNASSYSAAEIGLMAYYKHINDQGGIHGRMIELIPEDTACDQATGIAAVKKLIHQDKVFMLHGNSCSGVALAVKPTVEEAGLPWMVAHAVNQNISSPTVKNIFHGVPTSLDLGRAIGEFVTSKPDAAQFAIIAHSNEWALGYKDPLMAYFQDNGIEPVLDLVMERGSTDATPHVLRIREAKPDFIIAILYEAETAIFLRERAKFGVDAPVMGTLGTDLENTLARVGDMKVMDNYFVQHPYVAPLGDPKMQAFADIIKKYYPNESISSFSFASIGSAVAMVEALNQAGPDFTRDGVISALEGMKDFETGILAGPITFSPDDHSGVGAVAAAKYVDGEAVVFRAWDQPM